jgi:hypothetical protein
MFVRLAAGRIEPDTCPAESIHHRLTNSRIMLANAAGEHDQIDPIQHRDHRGNLFAHRGDDHRDRQPRIGICVSRLAQLAHCQSRL